MRTLFADTLYWVGLLDRRDPWHLPVVKAGKAIGEFHTVTTDAVLVEVLGAFSEASGSTRQWVVRFVRDLFARPDCTIVPHDRPLLFAAMDLYERRPDKEYSLTDCISMLVMRERRLQEVLTNDHHFEQEGFRILIPER